MGKELLPSGRGLGVINQSSDETEAESPDEDTILADGLQKPEKTARGKPNMEEFLNSCPGCPGIHTIGRRS